MSRHTFCILCHVLLCYIISYNFSNGYNVKIVFNTRLFLFLQVLNDAHLLMCALGAKNKDETVKVLASLKEYIR